MDSKDQSAKKPAAKKKATKKTAKKTECPLHFGFQACKNKEGVIMSAALVRNEKNERTGETVVQENGNFKVMSNEDFKKNGFRFC